jgi:hypothetical protein
VQVFQAFGEGTGKNLLSMINVRKAFDLEATAGGLENLGAQVGRETFTKKREESCVHQSVGEMGWICHGFPL